MWTLVYNQLDRAGEAVLTFNRDQAQQVIVREKRGKEKTKREGEVIKKNKEDIIKEEEKEKRIKH